MNRENKRIKYTKGYYKNHACNDSFICKVCGRPVVSAGPGASTETTVPIGLCSLHVDETPGDRASDCGGIMEPIGVWVRKGGEWAIIHRCRRCGNSARIEVQQMTTHEADVHCNETIDSTAVSAGAHCRAD